MHKSGCRKATSDDKFNGNRIRPKGFALCACHKPIENVIKGRQRQARQYRARVVNAASSRGQGISSKFLEGRREAAHLGGNVLNPSGGNLLLRTRKRAIIFSEHGERASFPRAELREFLIEALIITQFGSLSRSNQNCDGGLTAVAANKLGFCCRK